MEGDAEAEVIPVDLQKDWYCIFICSDSTGLFLILYILLNDFTSLSLAAMFPPPQFMKCEFQTLLLRSNLSFLFLYITSNTDSIHPTYWCFHGDWLSSFLFFSFQARWPCSAEMWCFVPCVVSYKCKWHDKQSAVKTESVRHHLTHELDPKLIPCFVHEQKACEKGSEGKREEGKKKEREQRIQQLQCSRGFVLFRIHLRESHMVQVDHKVRADMALPPPGTR